MPTRTSTRAARRDRLRRHRGSSRTPTTFGRVAAYVFLTVWIIGWVGMSGAYTWHVASGIVRHAAATEQPTVAGSVTASNPDDVTYTYTVDHQPYVGTAVRAINVFTSEDTGLERAIAYPVGTDVTVHYDPDDPGDAILEPGVRGGDWLALLFGVPFNGIALGSIMVAIAMARAGRRDFVPIVETQPARRIVRFAAPPYATALTAFIAAAFAVVLAVGVTSGADPSRPVMTVAFAVVLALTIIVFVRETRLRAAGARDLVIDDRDDTWTVPRRRKQPNATVPRDAIRAIAIRVSDHVDVDGDRHRTFHVELHAADGARDDARNDGADAVGTCTVYQLDRTRIPAEADHLVAWLRDAAGLDDEPAPTAAARALADT